MLDFLSRTAIQGQQPILRYYIYIFQLHIYNLYLVTQRRDIRVQTLRGAAQANCILRLNFLVKY